MKKISNRMSFLDCTFYKEHIFLTGDSVPVFNVYSYNGLNQIIGYAKYINPNNKILYRGECKIHNSMRPSINHTITSQRARDKANSKINKIIEKAFSDVKFCQFSKLNGTRTTDKYVMESVLQHYGIDTHCIDVVDNHWIALWFGQNRYIEVKNINKYCRYEPRIKNIYDIMEYTSLEDEKLYQYIILLAANYVEGEQGITITEDLITIDLRSALPSTFLRPHAQHGWVIRKNTHSPEDTYDLAENIVGILRIRIDYANKWIGNGNLLSLENLFPSPAYDQGYDVLLCRSDLFEDSMNSIVKYIY